MRLTGGLFLFLGGALCYILRQRERRTVLLIGRALAEDLMFLRWEICVVKEPLPAILKKFDRRSAAAGFWRQLLLQLEAGTGSLSSGWEHATAQLPLSLQQILSPLGGMLSAGGEILEKRIDETREELIGFLQTEGQRQDMAGRLDAAVCLSASCLLTLMLW